MYKEYFVRVRGNKCMSGERMDCGCMRGRVHKEVTSVRGVGGGWVGGCMRRGECIKK